MATPRLAAIFVALSFVAVACAGGSDGVTDTLALTEDAAESGDSSGSQLPRIEDTKAWALDDLLHPSFPEALIDINLLRAGGPSPDGIPPLDEPNFWSVEETKFLRDNEPILALEFNGEVFGYPVQIMTFHEIVNHEIGGTPVTVTFCPLCNSATAYPRSLPDGTELDFGTSGMLFNSSLLMYDRQTGSLWTHFDGRAVIGTLVGHELDLIPLQTVSWASFRDAFPNASVLNRNTGRGFPYGVNPYPGYDTVLSQPFHFEGKIDDRLPAKTHVVAVRGEQTIVFVTDDLAEAATFHATHDGVRIVVIHQPGTSTSLDGRYVSEGRDIGATGVFVAQADGQDLTFTSTGDGSFTDAETNSTWNIFGHATAGPLSGSRLEPVEHLDTFWFAISAFTPDAQIITIN